MDMENVIKWLDVCKTADRAVGLKEDYPCRECPYKGSPRCMRELVADALALLKDQQEQIEQMNFIYGFVYGGQVKEIKKLVRCNECRHRDPEDHKCDCGHDIQWQLPRADDWFCADGEEK